MTRQHYPKDSEMHTDYAQALFEAITESAVLLDKAGRIVDWNQGAATLFGYSKKEALGKSINIVYPHNYPFPKIIQDLLPRQKKWLEETRYIRKNGIRGFCKSSISLIHHSAPPHRAAALITHQDITAFKTLETEYHSFNQKASSQLKEQAEMAYLSHLLLIKNLHAHEHTAQILRESELRFHLLVENATDMISRHTPDGNYIYVSPSCKTLLGFSQEELMNVSAFKFIHHDDVSKLKKIFNRRKESPNYNTVTYRVRRKEGDYRWFESNLRTIYDEKFKTIREIQVTSRDVTHQIMDKKARLRGQQLARVSRLSSMEEMASGMAHEISQPLAAIVNYTQGCVRHLENNQYDPQVLTEIMKKAAIQAERAGEVIHRLKNFFCKGKLFKTSCKINSLIRETVSLIRSDLNASKTKMDFELAKEVQPISADKIQLQQVLLNLIQNSIDAMQDIDARSRRIHIKTKNLDTNSIEVTVTDTGPGFTKEAVSKAFEPFYTTKAHGRGMGLAISRSIIEAHGGHFTINPNTNRSWIRFVLPVT